MRFPLTNKNFREVYTIDSKYHPDYNRRSWNCTMSVLIIGVVDYTTDKGNFTYPL